MSRWEMSITAEAEVIPGPGPQPADEDEANPPTVVELPDEDVEESL